MFLSAELPRKQKDLKIKPEKIKPVTGLLADIAIILGIILALIQIYLPRHRESRQAAVYAVSEINKQPFLNAYIRVRSISEASRENLEDIIKKIYDQWDKDLAWQKSHEDFAYLLVNFEYISKMIELGYMDAKIIDETTKDMMKVFYDNTVGFKKKFAMEIPFKPSKTYEVFVQSFQERENRK